MPSYPKQIAGLTITSVVDLTLGYDSTNPPSYKPSLPLSSGHMIQFRAGSKLDGMVVVLTIRYCISHRRVFIADSTILEQVAQNPKYHFQSPTHEKSLTNFYCRCRSNTILKVMGKMRRPLQISLFRSLQNLVMCGWKQGSTI